MVEMQTMWFIKGGEETMTKIEEWWRHSWEVSWLVLMASWYSEEKVPLLQHSNNKVLCLRHSKEKILCLPAIKTNGLWCFVQVKETLQEGKSRRGLRPPETSTEKGSCAFQNPSRKRVRNSEILEVGEGEGSISKDPQLGDYVIKINSSKKREWRQMPK